MNEETEAMQQAETNGTIAAATEQQPAADGTAEDTGEEMKALFESLKAQNDALMEANKSLQSQVNLLIRTGANVVPAEPKQAEPQERYVSLSELGAELGKRDHHSHNTIQKE